MLSAAVVVVVVASVLVVAAAVSVGVGVRVPVPMMSTVSHSSVVHARQMRTTCDSVQRDVGR